MHSYERQIANHLVMVTDYLYEAMIRPRLQTELDEKYPLDHGSEEIE